MKPSVQKTVTPPCPISLAKITPDLFASDPLSQKEEVGAGSKEGGTVREGGPGRGVTHTSVETDRPAAANKPECCLLAHSMATGIALLPKKMLFHSTTKKFQNIDNFFFCTSRHF